MAIINEIFQLVTRNVDHQHISVFVYVTRQLEGLSFHVANFTYQTKSVVVDVKGKVNGKVVPVLN
jgi:hypothetical protein